MGPSGPRSQAPKHEDSKNEMFKIAHRSYGLCPKVNSDSKHEVSKIEDSMGLRPKVNSDSRAQASKTLHNHLIYYILI